MNDPATIGPDDGKARFIDGDKFWFHAVREYFLKVEVVPVHYECATERLWDFHRREDRRWSATELPRDRRRTM
ncbi:MAG: hypothetical protein HY360_07705 [Verrucomicrobia bacterium]|nr:hypothetical protein [Verrucomicrobiota bacterium]